MRRFSNNVETVTAPMCQNRSLSSRQKFKRRRLRLIPVIFLFLISIMGTTIIPARPSSFTWEDYTVKTGDTLWSIADFYTTNEEDVRVMVDRIIEANDLVDSANIHPGDRLEIPIEDNL